MRFSSFPVILSLQILLLSNTAKSRPLPGFFYDAMCSLGLNTCDADKKQAQQLEELKKKDALTQQKVQLVKEIGAVDSDIQAALQDKQDVINSNIINRLDMNDQVDVQQHRQIKLLTGSVQGLQNNVQQLTQNDIDMAQALSMQNQRIGKNQADTDLAVSLLRAYNPQKSTSQPQMVNSSSKSPSSQRLSNQSPGGQLMQQGINPSATAQRMVQTQPSGSQRGQYSPQSPYGIPEGYENTVQGNVTPQSNQYMQNQGFATPMAPSNAQALDQRNIPSQQMFQ